MRQRIGVILAILCSILSVGWESALHAQDYRRDTLSLRVYFHRGKSFIDPEYRGNDRRISEFGEALNAHLSDTATIVRTIIIRASASPEGNTVSNQRLSEARARSISARLVDSLGIDPSLFRTQAIGEDWEGLAREVGKLDTPWRDDALEIILNTPVWITDGTCVVDSRKNRLKTLEGGDVWSWLDRNVFPELRAAGGTVTCIIERPSVPQVDTVYIKETLRDTVFVGEGIPMALSSDDGSGREKPGRSYYPDFSKEKMLLAVRTNALAIPFANVGVEIPFGRHWSIGADWYYPWIWRSRHAEGLDYQGFCNELLAGDLELRYWFSPSEERPSHRLLGHSVGFYTAAGYYDFEKGFSGHQGEFINAGVDYLYALPLFKGLMHLEFELGLGYIYSPAQPYDTYLAGDKAYRQKGVTRYTRWIGPTRAQISLVVPLYVSKKEGGDQ